MDGCEKAVLLLDSYTVHQKVEVVGALNDVWTDVDFIPAGCTGLVQPCDVGINKPFKNHIQAKWTEWLIGHDDFGGASRPEVVSWIVDAWESISSEIVCNSFRRTGYELVE